MTWKDEFYEAVREYINRVYQVNAVTVIEVYDSSFSYENSLGGHDTEYECNISYRDAEGKGKTVTYYGRFSSLIENLT